MVAFVVLFSFGDGINSVTWALVGDFFGRRNFATIRGWIGMLQSFASMPAAVFTGWVYDQTQSYTYALLPFIIIYSLAALVLWWAPHPRRPHRLQVSTGQALDVQP
jgi:nitrate/nitrite transporter NarK